MKMSQVIAKCWADEGFKRKLLEDPATTLKAEGMELPAGQSIKVLEDDDKVRHLVIPAKPTELSDEDLDKVAAGWMCWWCGVDPPPVRERTTGRRHGIPFSPCRE